ncbi:transposable element Tcb2 transposase [Trichonephila clavipes]|uniref:Transposable element Tcb2 transposase n=1 Tax=Trichonephila clavipes TaxID=2585209 RepID=A0A8X6WC79_TRICX|nr:transposable element Tcb2 transposase [Trichonephila clavipes]
MSLYSDYLTPTGGLEYAVRLMKPWILHARSPDLNHIEPLTDVLAQGMKGHHTALTNLNELWTALANIWQVIPVESFQILIEFMPCRVAAVIKTRGGPTRYKYEGISGYMSNIS